MSRYIVSDETIFKLVWGLADMGRIPPGYDDSAEGKVVLANELRAMNVASCQRRYGDVPPGQDGHHKCYQKVPRPPLQTPVQFLKTLQAYLYQCAEDEIKSWPLYVYLDQVVQRALMMEIIAALPEYRDAPWE
jgi:hypothetical protein